MKKVNLDETKKLMIGYVDSGKVREMVLMFPALIAELIAAREVVEAAREFDDVCSHGIYVNERISHALLDYDEVINDTNT